MIELLEMQRPPTGSKIIFVSLNIWGLGSKPKRDAFKGFLDILKTIVILLQDTMTNVGSAYDYFLKLRLHWHV